jgi:hypothetical protein
MSNRECWDGDGKNLGKAAARPRPHDLGMALFDDVGPATWAVAALDRRNRHWRTDSGLDDLYHKSEYLPFNRAEQ